MLDGDNKDFNKKVRKIAVTSVISCCMVIVFYFCIKRNVGLGEVIGDIVRVLQPLLMGFCMAFLMNPIMKFFEKYIRIVFSKICKDQKKLFISVRTISAILSLIVLVGIVALFIALVVPELIDTITYLAKNINRQIAAVLDWCNDITGGRYEEQLMNAKDSKLDEAIDKGVNLVEDYLDFDRDKMVDLITSSVIGIGKIVINLIIGMFVSVYVLVSKESFKGQIKKIICGHFKGEHANIIMEVSRKSGDIFYGFIIGKIVDSIIIGIICYISCLIMNMPYATLVSVIIGVTNIIPVFGPYIGAIPTVIIIFLTEPVQGIYFLIFILVLQQIDGNLIGPKILGDSTGISSFWVVFAVVVGGGLFGVIGMIIGVPIVAIIYYLLGRHAKYMVRKRNLPEETTLYVNMEKIDLSNNTLIIRDEEEIIIKDNKHTIKQLLKKKK